MTGALPAVKDDVQSLLDAVRYVLNALTDDEPELAEHFVSVLGLLGERKDSRGVAFVWRAHVWTLYLRRRFHAVTRAQLGVTVMVETDWGRVVESLERHCGLVAEIIGLEHEHREHVARATHAWKVEVGHAVAA